MNGLKNLAIQLNRLISWQFCTRMKHINSNLSACKPMACHGNPGSDGGARPKMSKLNDLAVLCDSLLMSLSPKLSVNLSQFCHFVVPSHSLCCLVDFSS